MRILVTGGSGFIGSALCRYIIEQTDWSVVNVSRSPYSASTQALDLVRSSDRYHFAQGDITDINFLRQTLWTYSPEAVIHLAGESSVDKSLVASQQALESNILGTNTLLDATCGYWRRSPDDRKSRFRFIYVSTVEVYGSLGHLEKFKEDCPYRSSSPYAASKAASEQLVWACGASYGLPIIITNCSNNYGPYQSTQKLIPATITRAMNGEKIPVYGSGQNTRNWLYVDDHVKALLSILRLGQPFTKYNIGTSDDLTNLAVVKRICHLLDELLPSHEYSQRETLIEFVQDRTGHNFRSSIDWSKINQEINWSPTERFDSGLEKTVKWYINHEGWWRSSPLAKVHAVA
ncbi:dTDP-glucose 4,6-dehydratase [Oculatella sp. LEGE 06141]|uniref:dTDP-glucose 4,6-dehydratase n=1 Tax=Oculatella sp. LEGE 06141 TaxID=1828648 RepID=UPI00187FCD85|nr:dTDP-glucose 4,6-dehydratase [Oculatella sp. LEGE 06141]MBE9181909.1 dTDP-glucose 4,6-dehydratase [Oculatella sp. LEGE 06141]